MANQLELMFNSPRRNFPFHPTCHACIAKIEPVEPLDAVSIRGHFSLIRSRLKYGMT
jgi:hypothetical protein